MSSERATYPEADPTLELTHEVSDPAAMVVSPE